jgi:hypothetical protein
LPDDFALDVVDQQTSLQVPLVPERGSTACEATPSGFLLLPRNCSRSDDPTLFCSEARQDREDHSAHRACGIDRFSNTPQHDSILLFQVVSSRNTEEQVASKPIELPQQQHREHPLLCEFDNPLEAWPILGPLGSRHPGIAYNVDQRVSLQLRKAADRALLDLQSMARGSLFFGRDPDVPNSLGGDRFGLYGSVGRSSPEEPDPVATVHVAAVQILENLYASGAVSGAGKCHRLPLINWLRTVWRSWLSFSQFSQCWW